MRPSWVEVDLAAVADNVRALAAAAAPALLCAVVKADGYGHGDVPVAEAALDAGASWLAVALVEEGVRLREAGVEAPILLLSEPPPDTAGEIIRWRLTPTVYGGSLVDALSATASEPLSVHLKVDTGMHRVGAPPARIVALARRVMASPTLELEGLWTHLAVAEEDLEFTERQLAVFRRVVKDLAAAGIAVPMLHAQNTAGTLVAKPGFAMVRVGLGIYGLRPAPGLAPEVPLRPAMRVVSHVSHVARHPAGTRPSYGRRRPMPREGTVATVPVGYADGFPRLLGTRGGEVLIGGRRHPLAGNVTMDQIVVDVGDEPVDVGDEVVLLGRQGAETIPAEEWADRLHTITYEVVCQIGPRLPRRYRS